MSSECQLSILQDFLQLFIPEYCLRVVSNVYSFQNMKFIKNNRNAILAPPFSEWQGTKKIKGSRKKKFVKSLTFSREVLYFLHFFWIEQIEILIAVKILVVDTWQQFVIWHYFFFRENVSAELFSIFDVRNWHLNTIWVHQSNVFFLNWFFFFQNSWKIGNVFQLMYLEWIHVKKSVIKC